MIPDQMPKSSNDTTMGGTVFEHPAFGQVVITKCNHAPGTKLHGSELVHSQTVRLSVSEGTVRRSLSSNWYNDGATIVEIEMSEAQWARMVSSQGMGSGTPCTIRRRQEGQLKAVPGIAVEDKSKTDKAGEEMRRSMRKALDDQINTLTALLQLMDNKGELPKKMLREKLFSMKCHLENMGPNVEFVNAQFKDSMESIVEDAKTEVEAFVTNAAISTGIEALKQLKIPEMGGKPKNLLIKGD